MNTKKGGEFLLVHSVKASVNRGEVQCVSYEWQYGVKLVTQ